MPGMKNTLDEFAAGSLRSGSKNGPPVTNRKQAIAIGLSEDKRATKTRGSASVKKLALARRGKVRKPSIPLPKLPSIY